MHEGQGFDCWDLTCARSLDGPVSTWSLGSIFIVIWIWLIPFFPPLGINMHLTALPAIGIHPRHHKCIICVFSSDDIAIRHRVSCVHHPRKSFDVLAGTSTERWLVCAFGLRIYDDGEKVSWEVVMPLYPLFPVTIKSWTKNKSQSLFSTCTVFTCCLSQWVASTA